MRSRRSEVAYRAAARRFASTDVRERQQPYHVPSTFTFDAMARGCRAGRARSRPAIDTCHDGQGCLYHYRSRQEAPSSRVAAHTDGADISFEQYRAGTMRAARTSTSSRWQSSIPFALPSE